MEFNEWFNLKNRDTFTIDPKIYKQDARFYFGRHEIIAWLKGVLRRSFIDPKTPKIFISGPYGSGKTQLLYHIAFLLESYPPETLKQKIKIVHLNIEMKSKSDHKHLHLQLMESLGKEIVTQWVDQLSKNTGKVEDSLKNIFSDSNVAEAIRKLLIGGLELTAWRWLCGYELSAKDLEQLKVTRNLGSIGAGEMAGALIEIGSLAELNGEKVLFLMDEAERFAAIRSGDGADYLVDYLRELADKSNKTIGFVIAATARAEDEIPFLFTDEAIRRAGRIGPDHYKRLEYLSAVSDVQNFLYEMLKELVDQEKADKKIKNQSLLTTLKTYPLDADGFDNLCDSATREPDKALPSHIIHCLNECAITAWDNKKSVIDSEIVGNMAPFIFG